MLGYYSSPPPASIGCRPATCRGNCRLPPIRAEGPNRCRSTSSRWRWLRRSACSSSTPTSSAANSTSANRMLRGGVCGILGFGKVGVATARLMRAFGMKIHAINRRGASDEPTDWIATADLLDEMLRVADVLVISAALTTATEGLIGARELDLMKENAILINVARGEIIDEGALYAHLVAHPHFFAGIDAWWVEPVRHGRFTMGHPFLHLPNVIGSPHNSAGGGAWRDEYLRRAVRNCRRAILGETPWNLIGPDERML